MDNSTTSGRGLQPTRLSGMGWVGCVECHFEYPAIVEDCPECYPPAVPAPKHGRRTLVGAMEREPRTEDEVLEIMDACGVNVYSFQHATLDTFEGEDAGHLHVVREWTVRWEDTYGSRWPRRDWMYLYGAGSSYERKQVRIGQLGNGKTHLGVALARDLLQRNLLDRSEYRFVTAEALLLEMEATFRSGSEDSEFRLLAKYEKLPLLHVDDLGVREPSPHAMRVLDELTKRRQGKATIWTSNLSLKVIAEASPTLQRIISRIAGECGEGAQYVLKFSGPDRRVERSKQGRTP